MVPFVEVRACEGGAFQNEQVLPHFTLTLTLRHPWQNATFHHLREKDASSAGAGGTNFNGTKFHPTEELSCKASWLLPRMGKVTRHPGKPTLSVCSFAKQA